jgi:hypothetical protein
VVKRSEVGGCALIGAQSVEVKVMRVEVESGVREDPFGVV